MERLINYFRWEAEQAHQLPETPRYAPIAKVGEVVRRGIDHVVCALFACTPREEESGRAVLGRLCDGVSSPQLKQLAYSLEVKPVDRPEITTLPLVLHHVHNFVYWPLTISHCVWGRKQSFFWLALYAQLNMSSLGHQAGIEGHVFNTLPSLGETLTGRLLTTWAVTTLVLRFSRLQWFYGLFKCRSVHVIGLVLIANPLVRSQVYRIPGFRPVTEAVDQMVYETGETIGYALARIVQVATVRLSRECGRQCEIGEKVDPSSVSPPMRRRVAQLQQLGSDLFGKKQREVGLALIAWGIGLYLHRQCWFASYNTTTTRAIYSLEMLSGTTPLALGLQSLFIGGLWKSGSPFRIGGMGGLMVSIQHIESEDWIAAVAGSALFYWKQSAWLAMVPLWLSKAASPFGRTLIKELVRGAW